MASLCVSVCMCVSSSIWFSCRSHPDLSAAVLELETRSRHSGVSAGLRNTGNASGAILMFGAKLWLVFLFFVRVVFCFTRYRQRRLSCGTFLQLWKNAAAKQVQMN